MFLRFLLSVTYFSEGMKHDAPLNGLTDRRDIAGGVWVWGYSDMISPNRSALGVLSFASAKESTKEKQPGKPFCEKVSRDSSKGEGHFRWRRENAWTHNAYLKTRLLVLAHYGGSSVDFTCPALPALGYFARASGFPRCTIRWVSLLT